MAEKQMIFYSIIFRKLSPSLTSGRIYKQFREVMQTYAKILGRKNQSTEMWKSPESPWEPADYACGVRDRNGLFLVFGNLVVAGYNSADQG